MCPYLPAVLRRLPRIGRGFDAIDLLELGRNDALLLAGIVRCNPAGGFRQRYGVDDLRASGPWK